MRSANECRCWTQEELENIGGSGDLCVDSRHFALLQGVDTLTGEIDQIAAGDIFAACLYLEWDPTAIMRTLTTTSDETESCRQSILTECTDRGLL